ncbi:histone-like nucleoid-structuring protein Lsr2 [Streptomyces asoensis]|uniref:WhiB family transcriptional regulator n=1 Tax=Streptomyces asoensis TaxID=249586 RepID=UPI0036AA4002
MTLTVLSGVAWQSHAACDGQDTRIFFRPNATAARAICARCPVRAECLHDALVSDATNGVWGGLTVSERKALPELLHPPSAAIAALRDLLDAHDLLHPVSTTQESSMTTAPADAPALEPAAPPVLTAVPEAATRRPSETLPTGRLLKWADSHDDEDIRDQAARARATLAGLRHRYDTDKELTELGSEAEQLERRLAEVRAREAELAPPKAKKSRTPVDYPAAEVRAWARDNSVPCPPTGRVPKAVVEAWRAATSPAASGAK